MSSLKKLSDTSTHWRKAMLRERLLQSHWYLLMLQLVNLKIIFILWIIVTCIANVTTIYVIHYGNGFDRGIWKLHIRFIKYLMNIYNLHVLWMVWETEMCFNFVFLYNNWWSNWESQKQKALSGNRHCVTKDLSTANRGLRSICSNVFIYALFFSYDQ